MKYLIILVIAGLLGYIGFGFSMFYKNREKFFKGLELLFENLKTEIKFSRNKVIEILQSYNTNSKEVRLLLNNFINCLEYDLNISSENLFKNIKILHDDEKNILLIFFKSIGKFDAYNQTNQLENQKNELHGFYKKAEEESKKYTPLYMKLGVILGLVIGLIFL